MPRGGYRGYHRQPVCIKCKKKFAPDCCDNPTLSQYMRDRGKTPVVKPGEPPIIEVIAECPNGVRTQFKYRLTLACGHEIETGWLIAPPRKRYKCIPCRNK